MKTAKEMKRDLLDSPRIAEPFALWLSERLDEIIEAAKREGAEQERERLGFRARVP